MQYEYKGYAIYPAPYYVVRSSCWRLVIAIKHNNVIKEYCNDKFFFTKGEAVYHSIQFGKKLIDDGIILIKEAA